MVPGSTLMYGSNFCSRTRRPRRSSNNPIEALVIPLPRELTTPPVTKMCLAIDRGPLFRPKKRQKPTGASRGLGAVASDYDNAQAGEWRAMCRAGRVFEARRLCALCGQEFLPQRAQRNAEN